MTDVREGPPLPPFDNRRGLSGEKQEKRSPAQEQHKQETANRLAVPSKKVSERRRRRRKQSQIYLDNNSRNQFANRISNKSSY